MSEHKISPSQLKTAFHSETGCKRKWAFNKIEGQRSPPTAATTLGTNVHTVAENYLNLGTVPDLSTKPGKIFASGIHLLPDRKLITGVEKNFNLRFNDDVTFHGIMDFVGDDFVGDHKTTSNFKYMIAPEDLQTDYQGVLYGMDHAISRNLGMAEKFKLIWVYYLTKGKPQARKVQIETSRVQLERTYFPLAEKAEELVKLRQTVENALEVEPTYSACGAFGGCPFRNKCESEKPIYGFSKQNMEKSSMSSLLERLKAKQAIKKPKSQIEKKVKPSIAMNLDYVDPNEAVGSSEVALTAAPPKKPKAAETLSINPPEIVAESETVKAEKPAKKKRGRPKGAKSKSKVNPKIQKILSDMSDAVVDVAEKMEKPESQNEITEKCDAPAELILEVPEEAKRYDSDPVAEFFKQREAEKKPVPQTDTGYTLFIDCAPKVYNDLTLRLSQIANDCAESNEVDHYRMIPYGQGKAAFSMSVRKSLKQDPLAGNIVIDSMNLMASDCLEELIANADGIVRAFK